MNEKQIQEVMALVDNYAQAAYGLCGASASPQKLSECRAAIESALREQVREEAERPNSMDVAPTDGTLLRLLVEFENGSLEDGTEPCWTIGFNNLGNTGIDEWQFAGWNWTHDNFCQGSGIPIGWLPMLSAAPTQPAQPETALYCTYPKCQTTGGCKGICSTTEAQPAQAYDDPIARNKSPASLMARAYALCPTDLPHLKKMEWMADFYGRNRAQPAQAEQPTDEWPKGESYEDLWNALQAIDTAAVRLPGFEVIHEGGLDAVTKNIVEAMERLAAQQEPVYQYQLASGAWIDQAKDSYDYNVKHGQDTVRVLYTEAPQREPMTEQNRITGFNELEAPVSFTDFCAGVRYAERFHHITKKEQQ